MIEWKHAIPGYGYLDLYNTINSDAPFAIKVRDAGIAGATIALHTIFATHHAVKILEHQIATRGFYGGRTHGWGAIRHVIKASPLILAATLQAAAGHHIAEGGAKGVDLYTEVERQQINQGMFKHVSGVGTLVI